MVLHMIGKEYLGDSVYAEWNAAGMLVLTTENGRGPSNLIFLEPEVISALLRFLEKAKKQNERSQNDRH